MFSETKALFTRSQPKLWAGMALLWIGCMGLLGGAYFAPIIFVIVLFLLFSLPGYLLCQAGSRELDMLTAVLSTLFGMAIIVTLFAILRFFKAELFFLANCRHWIPSWWFSTGKRS